MQHFKYGGSSADRWLHCSLSAHSRELGLDFDAENIYTKEGTEAHAVAENLIRGWQPPADVDPDMLLGAKQYALIISMIQEFYPGHSHIEYQVSSPRLHPDIGGTVDFLHVSPQTNSLWVVDYKYGQGVAVSAESNKQLMLYAALYLNSVGREASQFNDIHLVIVQPRAKTSVKTHVKISYADVVNFTNRVQEALQAPLKATVGDWCRWCQVKPKCKAYAQQHHLIDTDYEDAELLSDEALLALLEAKKELTTYFGGVSKYVKRRATEPGGFLGLKTAYQEGRSLWKDEVRAEKEIPESQYPAAYERKLKTPNQVLELYPELGFNIISLHTKLINTILKPINENEHQLDTL